MQSSLIFTAYTTISEPEKQKGIKSSLSLVQQHWDSIWTYYHLQPKELEILKKMIISNIIKLDYTPLHFSGCQIGHSLKSTGKWPSRPYTVLCVEI